MKFFLILCGLSFGLSVFAEYMRKFYLSGNFKTMERHYKDQREAIFWGNVADVSAGAVLACALAAVAVWII